jgi:hypothetical protein
MDEGATGACFLSSWSVFGFAVLISIQPLLQTYLPLPSKLCDSPDHAAHYHIFCLQVRGFISYPAPGWLQTEEASTFFTGFVIRWI